MGNYDYLTDPDFKLEDIAQKASPHMDRLLGAEADPNAPAAPASDQAQQEQSTWYGDIAKGAMSGLTEGIEEDINTGVYFTTLGQVDHALEFSYDYEPTTVAGSITKGAAKWLPAFIGAGKVLKPLAIAGRVAKGVSSSVKSTRIARASGTAVEAMAAGAIADVASFSDYETNTMDFLSDELGLKVPVLDYLRSEANDSKLEAKLKNGIQGALLGVVTDGTIHGITAAYTRYFKYYKTAKAANEAGNTEQAATIMKEGVDKIREIYGDQLARAMDSGAENQATFFDLNELRRGTVYDETVKGEQLPKVPDVPYAAPEQLNLELAGEAPGKASYGVPPLAKQGELELGVPEPVQREMFANLEAAQSTAVSKQLETIKTRLDELRALPSRTPKERAEIATLTKTVNKLTNAKPSTISPTLAESPLTQGELALPPGTPRVLQPEQLDLTLPERPYTTQGELPLTQQIAKETKTMSQAYSTGAKLISLPETDTSFGTLLDALDTAPKGEANRAAISQALGYLDEASRGAGGKRASRALNAMGGPSFQYVDALTKHVDDVLEGIGAPTTGSRDALMDAVQGNAQLTGNARAYQVSDDLLEVSHLARTVDVTARGSADRALLSQIIEKYGLPRISAFEEDLKWYIDTNSGQDFGKAGNAVFAILKDSYKDKLNNIEGVIKEKLQRAIVKETGDLSTSERQVYKQFIKDNISKGSGESLDEAVRKALPHDTNKHSAWEGPARDWQGKSKQYIRRVNEDVEFDAEMYAEGLRRSSAIGLDLGDWQEGKWFNHTKMEGGMEAKAAINSMAIVLEREAKALWGDKQTLQQVAEQANEWLEDMTSVGPGRLKLALGNLARDADRQASILVASKQYMQSLAKQIAETSEEIGIAGAKAGDAEYEKLLKMMEDLAQVQAHLKGVQVASARTTAAGRIQTGPSVPNVANLAGQEFRAELGDLGPTAATAMGGMPVERVQTFLAKAPREVLVGLARAFASTSGDPKAINFIAEHTMGRWSTAAKTLKATGGMRRLIEAFNEVYINGILSSPKTFTVNILGNFLNAMSMPFEQYVGGVATNNSEVKQKALATYVGMAKSIQESWKAAAQAFRAGKSLMEIDLNQADYVSNQKLSVAYLSQASGVVGKMTEALPGWGKTGLDKAGQAIRLPSKVQTMADEFFKQITTRGKLYSYYAYQGQKAGYTANALADFIQTNVDSEIARAMRDPDNASEIFKSAQAFGREATFNQPLKYKKVLTEAEKDHLIKMGTDPDKFAMQGVNRYTMEKGTFLGDVHSFVNDHPTAKMVLPFVKTPANVFKAWRNRTPGLNLLFDEYRSRFFQGSPEDKARAMGEMATGTTAYLGAWALASSGMISGWGPPENSKNVQLRKRWLEAGNQPYSIRVGDKWIQYNRLDPFGSFLGTVADLVAFGPNLKQDSAGEIASALVLWATSMTENKVFLQSFMDLGNAFSGDKDAMMTYLKRQAVAHTVPYSAALRSTRQAFDDKLRYLKETHDLMNYYANSIPGLSTTLPADVSWVTGEEQVQSESGIVGRAMIPFNVKSARNDPTLNELISIGRGFADPERKIKGVELTKEQYVDLKRLHGTLMLDGKTMKERMDELVSSPAYQNLKGSAVLNDDLDDPRVKMVRRVIKPYREAAINKLLTLNPDLLESIKTQVGKQRQLEAQAAQ